MTNFTEMIISQVFLKNFTRIKNYFTQVPLVPLVTLVTLVTNSMSAQADRKNRLGLKPLDETIHKTFEKIGN